MIFGVVALLMFVFPMFDLPLGILGVIFAFVALGIKTDGRDVGHHMARVGMFASVVSLILAGVFWYMGDRNRNEQEKKLAGENAELVETLTGVWKANSDNNVSLEFTPGGNLIFAELASDNDDAEPLRETAGLYQVTNANMVVAFGSQSTKFTWELLPSGELMVMAPSDRDIRLPINGKWRKIKTLKMGIDYSTASPELKKYFEQLDEYTERKKVLIKTLVKYRDEKDGYVKQLNGIRESNGERDDRWRVLGRDLKAVNGSIDLVKERVSDIDRVIVRLQGVIRNEGRQADIERLGMSEEELVKLLETSHELEDKLKIQPEAELLNDAEVERMLEEVNAKENDTSAVK